jgi:hypothetical protein
LGSVREGSTNARETDRWRRRTSKAAERPQWKLGCDEAGAPTAPAVIGPLLWSEPVAEVGWKRSSRPRGFLGLLVVWG